MRVPLQDSGFGDSGGLQDVGLGGLGSRVANLGGGFRVQDLGLGSRER